MEPIESEKYRGYSIEVFIDEDPFNPVENFDMLGTFVLYHPRYTLGDTGLGITSIEDCHEYVKEKRTHGAAVLPVYIYDHSGITISTNPFSCPWDSWQIGYIFCDKEKYKAEGFTMPKAEEMLRANVEVYDRYLRGEVYGYVIKDPSGGDFDSCWGYYDSPEIVIGICKEDIDHDANENLYPPKDEFIAILEEVVKENAHTLLTVPEILETLSGYFHVQVIDRWRAIARKNGTVNGRALRRIHHDNIPR
jgi:hypothetical protein